MDTRDPAILQVIPRLDVGGAERVVVEITEALARLNVRALVASAGGVLATNVERAGGQNCLLPLDTKNPFRILRNAKRLAKLIARENVGLIHAHSRAPAWSARLAAKRTGICFVTTYHGSYGEKGRLKHRYNAVMAAGDRVIAVSHFIADLIRTRYHTPEERLRVIHGGVDPRKFDPAVVSADRLAALARLWRIPDGAPVILLPGRLTSWKGQGVLIAAQALLARKDAIVVLAGADQGRARYAASLVHQAERLGVADRIRLAGHTEDMATAYRLADIVVNASTDPEAFGRTIVEAQAMGRMVIATDHGGARETVRRDDTGFLVPPNDPQALAAAIDHALALRLDERLALCERAQNFIRTEYSIAAMQERVIDVYRELI